MVLRTRIPDYIVETAWKLQVKGFRAWLVGGALRDLLMKRNPHDWDIATDALPQDVMAIFPHTIPTGEKFGCVTVVWDNYRMKKKAATVEVTTLRGESDYEGHKPTKVEFKKDILGDLARRDFTINAIAWEVISHQIHLEDLIDPYKGFSDIKNGLVRAVRNPYERFDEDPLRILRAIRLSAQTGFRIEEGTREAIKILAYKVTSMSWERIRQELEKILLSDSPALGIRMLEDLGLLRLVLPSVHQTVGVAQNPKYHYTDVFNHTLDALKLTPPDLEVRLAVLLHDVGKACTSFIGIDGEIHAYDHEIKSVELAEQELARLRFSNRTIQRVATLIREHMADPSMGDKAIRRLIMRLESSRAVIRQFLAVKYADLLSCSFKDAANSYFVLRDRIYRLCSEDKIESAPFKLAVSGHDIMELLNLKSGPEVGEIKELLTDWALEDPETRNNKEVLRRQLSKSAQSGMAPVDFLKAALVS